MNNNKRFASEKIVLFMLWVQNEFSGEEKGNIEVEGKKIGRGKRLSWINWGKLFKKSCKHYRNLKIALKPEKFHPLSPQKISKFSSS